MSQINVNKVISPTQAASNGPSIEVASNGNMSIDTDTVFVDSTNDRLGIGTSSPARTLDIQQFGGISFIVEEVYKFHTTKQNPNYLTVNPWYINFIPMV